MPPSNFRNLVNEKFGRLTVIKRVENNKFGESRWYCECDCGGNTTCRSGDLNSGNTVSCGCFRKENAGKQSKKYNLYNITDYDYGIGYTFKNEEFYFDLEDYELIKDHCWCINSMGYVIALKPNTSTKMYFHRYILNFPEENTDVDHKNKNKVDNRKNNLRVVNHKTNMWNSTRNKKNVNGVTGIYKTNNNKWSARLGHFKLAKTFDLKNDAIVQRLKWELEYLGIDNAPQRHLFEEYGII